MPEYRITNLLYQYKPKGRNYLGRLLHAHLLLGLFFDTEDGENAFLRNVAELLPNLAVLLPTI
jgi:hypothetical protein